MSLPSLITEILYYQRDNFPLDKSMGSQKDGEWKYYSTDELIDNVNALSQGLIKLGVQAGDKIAVVAYKNRPEWVIVDLAIQQVGAITVPLYPSISAREYVYILSESETSYVFVGSGDLYDKVKESQAQVPTLKDIFTLDRQDGRPYWEDLFSDQELDIVGQRMAAIQENDLATIIYTSGTTGNPKGVMLSHRNIVSNVKAVSEVFPIGIGETAISFLPLCHIFERTASYSYLYNGIQVAFTGTDNLGGDDGDLRMVRPHFFTTVPRLLEKVYEKIYNKGLELSGIKRRLFFWALSLTEDYVYDQKHSGLAAIKWKIADRLIFSKWREALGGRVKGIVTGAAPCPEKLARVFSAAGIPIREGYGLTETSPGLCIARFTPGDSLLGTVAEPIGDVEIKIDTQDSNYLEGEGEILAKGSNIMMGYYKKPEATAKVIDEEADGRWFHTGDIGRWVVGSNGKKFLKITDRKKELLKTSGGKYIAPAPIENKLKEDFLVEQAMVIGDKRKFVSALIVPAVEALRDWCKNNDVPWDDDLQQVVDDPRVIEHYQLIVDRVNPEFSHIEQIKKFKLLAAQWDPIKEDGSAAELTPTLKMKRRVISDKFDREIESIYSET